MTLRALSRFNLLALALLAACQPQGQDPNTVVVGIEGNPTALDPRFATDAHASRIGSLLYNGLLKIADDGSLTGDLASSWSWADSTTLRMDIRPDVAFDGGEAFNCETARANLLWTADATHGSPRASGLESMASAECAGAVLTLALKTPNAAFPQALTQGMVPASQLDSGERAPHGTGPCRLVEWVPDFRVVLENREATSSVRRIEFRILADETTRMLEMQKGSVDFLYNAIAPYKLDALKAWRDIEIRSRPGSTYAYLGLNHQHPVLKDVSVRRALGLALDRDALLKHRLAGRARKAEALLAPENWAAMNLPVTPYDPATASQLLDEAGWKWNPPNPRFAIRYLTSNNDESVVQAEIVKSQWEAVGVAVQIQSYEWGTFFRDVQKGNYDVFSLRWIGVVEPDHLYFAYHSTMTPPRGANRIFYSSPEVDGWLEAARLEVDPAVRAPFYRDVQKRMADDVAVISLFHLDDVWLASGRLGDFTPGPGGRLDGLASVQLRSPAQSSNDSK